MLAYTTGGSNLSRGDANDEFATVRGIGYGVLFSIAFVWLPLLAAALYLGAAAR
jgi:hypothetical protein